MDAELDGSCVLRAWHEHEAPLRRWLRARVGEDETAEDLLQTLFLNAVRHGVVFCEVEHVRGWLYRSARNAVIDRMRLKKDEIPVPETLASTAEESAPLKSLASCLPQALDALSPSDADAIRRCDLEGMSQIAYAELQHLSIPGAKSRLQRARGRLREELTRACDVRLDEQGRVCCFRCVEDILSAG
ncbi:MAG: RNA polymerase subunit sigma-70 [Deltaproteobacteria bacterium]|nr:MAG: RNA polymerase subunit sigma-70 [Deltaproteobacteria bacterium]